MTCRLAPLLVCFVYFIFLPLSFAFAEEPRQADPATLIQSLAGCYSVRLDFREGAPGHDSYNFMKEKVVVQKIDNSYHIKHTTIIDETAHGEDPIIANWNRANGPVVFEHVTEVWTPLGEDRWQQATLAPHSHRLVYQCQGVWTSNNWSCNDIYNVPMMRRDRVKNRTDFKTIDITQSITISMPGMQTPYSTTLQRNTKRDENRNLVAIELGVIDYQKLPDSACAAAL